MTPVVLWGLDPDRAAGRIVEIVEVEAAAERIDLKDRVGDRAAHRQDVGAGENEGESASPTAMLRSPPSSDTLLRTAMASPSGRAARQAAAPGHPDVARQLGLAGAQRVCISATWVWARATWLLRSNRVRTPARIATASISETTASIS